MVRFFFMSLVMITCLIPVSGLHAQAKAERRILENFRKQEACWNKGDLVCYCEAYMKVDSVRTISSGGVTYGLDSILADYKKYWPPEKMGILHFDRLKLEKLSRKMYFVTGRFNLARKDGRHISGYFSAVMKKAGKKWLLYTDHSS